MNSIKVLQKQIDELATTKPNLTKIRQLADEYGKDQEGELIFFELGLSDEPKAQRRQKQLEPIFYWLFQGLHLNGIFHY